jgi:hypothetical protein
MTLSALQTKLTIRLASLHVRAHQDGHCDFNLLPRPAQLNVLADALASEALEELRAADQPTEFYPLPACRAYLRDGIGHITSCEKRTLRNEFTEYEIRSYLQQRNGWTAHILDSINWTVYRAAISAITNQVRIFAIKFSHDWLPVDVRDYRNGAAIDTCPQCIQLETSRHLYHCHSRTLWRDQFIDKLTKHLKDATTAADLRCTIVEGIQKWFTTVDTNESDEPDASTQLSWFQIIKGCIPNQWSISQAKLFRDQGLDSRYNIGERWTSQLTTFFWAQGHTLWKMRTRPRRGQSRQV